MHNGIHPDGEEEWRAKHDYDALVTAEVVKADSARMKKAKAWGKKFEKAKAEEAKAAEAVQDL